MNNTGLKDKHGREIFLGDRVLFRGNVYDVMVNDFNHRVVIDSDVGQGYLIDYHMHCELINE